MVYSSHNSTNLLKYTIFQAICRENGNTKRRCKRGLCRRNRLYGPFFVHSFTGGL
jgi:hypothetical protein